MPTFCGRAEIRKCAHTQTIKTNGQPQKWNMRNRSATWCAIIKYDFKWLEGMHYEYTRMSFDLYLNPDSTRCVCVCVVLKMSFRFQYSLGTHVHSLTATSLFLFIWIDVSLFLCCIAVVFVYSTGSHSFAVFGLICWIECGFSIVAFLSPHDNSQHVLHRVYASDSCRYLFMNCCLLAPNI